MGESDLGEECEDGEKLREEARNGRKGDK